MVCDDCFETDECRCGPGEKCGVCFESKLEPEKPALMCTCGHSRNWHPRANGYACMGDNCLDCAEFTCDHTRCGWKSREEAHDFSSPAHCAACMKTWIGRGVAAMEAEPPLTPEEEEEAGDWHCMHKNGCTRLLEDVCLHGCRDAADELSRESKGMQDPDAPPQPERRPPYAVAYSVQGHLFEVALSGDATVRAVDGALVIQHHLGPVAGIVSVLPVINKES